MTSATDYCGLRRSAFIGKPFGALGQDEYVCNFGVIGCNRPQCALHHIGSIVCRTKDYRTGVVPFLHVKFLWYL